MEFSPRRSWLYRNRRFAVILAATAGIGGACLVAQVLTQYARKPAIDKGPRALGLVQLAPKGKARFTPIAIMMDGKFYDAGAYKADPVPMALDYGTVYEGFRSGVSLGVFTVTLPGQLKHAWIAEGTWLAAGEKGPETHKKFSVPVIEDKDAPPVLHRHSEKTDSDSGSDGKDKDNNKDKDQQKPASPASPTAAPAASTAPAEAAKASAPALVPDAPYADPNRPRLRRGKPETIEHRETFTTFDALTDVTPGTSAAVAQAAFIPAISDAGGPDPRPYTYDLKPAEEAAYRGKMLDLAAQLGAQATAAAKEAASTSKKAAGKHAAKMSKPAFDDIKLRIFDLSNSNEPVLVLSAKTHAPEVSSTGNAEEPKEITLIARTNLEGELQKLFFAQTDSRHLDVSPRMELIDAVDADGDGRGELLFRRTFDEGSAYAIYRVTADQLWPLFEGTP